MKRVFEFRAESSLRPGSTMLRDFRFKQPNLDLEARAQTDHFTDHSMYYFPGEYVDPALGPQIAKVRLEEPRARGLATLVQAMSAACCPATLSP